jgi:nicotinate-nucleotide pyrophosphorylase (carboxylating)
LAALHEATLFGVQRMSGIATAAATMVSACAGTKAKILDTRKTVPGLRLLDKWAVVIGGGCNHRIGLYDMIMIKDNHIAAAGGLTAAVRKAAEYLEQCSLKIPVEVEVRTPDEVEELIQCLDQGWATGVVTRVMLDNMAKADRNAEGTTRVALGTAAASFTQTPPAYQAVRKKEVPHLLQFFKHCQFSGFSGLLM